MKEQMRDLYEVLGVPENADERTIKKAYRALAKKNHPDANPDNPAAEARFKEASAAYEVLSNPEKRALYDEFGVDSLRQGFDAEQARAFKNAYGGGGFRGARPGQGFGFDFGNGANVNLDPNDLFEELFGGFGGGFAGRRQPRSPRVARGQDLRASVTLDFRAGALGARREFHFEGGRSIKVNIPSGVEDGETLRLRGKGMPAPNGVEGGQPGDLLLEIHLTEDENFSRDGLDLHLDIPLTLGEAIHGARVKVPTLDGEVTLKVRAGTQSGQVMRLRGKGISRKGRGQGDLYVNLQVRLPEVTSEEEKRALEVLERAYGAHPRERGSRTQHAA